MFSDFSGWCLHAELGLCVNLAFWGCCGSVQRVFSVFFRGLSVGLSRLKSVFGKMKIELKELTMV